jgi:anti-sigma B factor antagonist
MMSPIAESLPLAWENGMPVIESVSERESWKVTEPEIMKLSGRLDSITAPEMEEDVLLCIQSGARDMILDCDELTYITGAGVQSLLRVAREMQAVRGKIAVCNLHERAIFDFCGLDSVIPVYESLSAAREAMAA